MNTNTANFLQKLSADHEILTQALSTPEGADRLLALAKEHGVSAEDLQAVASFEPQAPASMELDDEDLDKVSGGVGSYTADPAMAEQIMKIANMMVGQNSNQKLLQLIKDSENSTYSLPITISLLPRGN